MVVACKKKEMRNNFSNTANPSVYPGEYVPLFNEKDFKKTAKHSANNNKMTHLPANIKELGNSYKIELAVPGVKRENLLLKVSGNALSISVIYNNYKPDKQKKFQLHEFNFDRCFTRKIALPHNADPSFVSAEYKAGILHLYIPKSTHPLKWTNTKIAIY